MIASNQGDLVRVSERVSIKSDDRGQVRLLGFQAHKESKRLQAEVAPINEVA